MNRLLLLINSSARICEKRNIRTSINTISMVAKFPNHQQEEVYGRMTNMMKKQQI